jgi:UDP-N-acetylglucosamine:LPS N-acetylglucosamine transferase
MNKNTKTIFLLAGRTGGPIMPLLATFKGILEVEKSENQNISQIKNKTESQFEAVIIGVKNGFEEKLAKQENLKLELLPEAKLELLSFGFRFEKSNWKQNLSQIGEFLVGIGKFFLMIYLLLNSILGSFWLIWKYRPTAILSSGSFLAIPVLWSSHIWNFVNFKNIFGQKILIITHQQDPIPGLASKLTFNLGKLQTCVFDYS